MSAAKNWMALSLDGKLFRPEAAQSNLTTFCPHCGDGFSVHAGAQRMKHFTHASSDECRQKNWSFLVARCAELLTESLGQAVELAAKGGHVRVVAKPVALKGRALLEVMGREGAGSVGAMTVLNAQKFAGRGELLASYLQAAKASLESAVAAEAAEAVVSPVALPVAAPVVEPVLAPALVPVLDVIVEPAPLAPTAPLVSPAAPAEVAPEPASANTLPRPAVLPAHFAKNLAMRGLTWEMLPQWVVEPVPTAQAIGHAYLDWQMAVIVLVVEKPAAGQSRSISFVADYLVNNKTMVEEVERRTMVQCAKELFARLSAEGYLTPATGEQGFAKRTAKPCPWPTHR